MTFDASRGEIILFGGKNATSTNWSARTWAWTGTSWLQRTPAVSPPARANHAMAFHTASGLLIMFGGDNGAALANVFGDTWSWNGTTWTQLTPPTPPPRRSRSAMAYDSNRQRLVLFGGDVISGNLGDTWEWSGASWIQATPTSSPSPRHHHNMAEDPGLGRVVLFGGTTDRASNNFNDTWEWTGFDWNQRNNGATSSPSIRFRASMTFHAATPTPSLTLFGGRNGATYFADTWAWNSATGAWAQRPTLQNPEPRAGATMAHDQARGQLLLFGGWVNGSPDRAFNDTWEFGSTFTAVATAFGSGCPSANPLTLVTTGPPLIGAPIAIQATAFAAGELAVLAAGFSDQHSSLAGLQGALPLTLTVAGVACSLFVDPVATTVGVPAGGMAVWPTTIPNNPALRGTTLFVQGAGLGGNGFRTTNAMMLRIG